MHTFDWNRYIPLCSVHTSMFLKPSSTFHERVKSLKDLDYGCDKLVRQSVQFLKSILKNSSRGFGKHREIRPEALKAPNEWRRTNHRSKCHRIIIKLGLGWSWQGRIIATRWNHDDYIKVKKVQDEIIINGEISKDSLIDRW